MNGCALLRGINAKRLTESMIKLTDQIVGGHDDATHEEYGTGDAIVAPENHVVDDRLFDQVAHLHKTGHGRDQPEKRHLADGILRGGGDNLRTKN